MKVIAIFLFYSVSQGRLKYSKVSRFLQKQHNVTAMYRIISILSNDTITLTDSHLIYTRKSINDKFNAR